MSALRKERKNKNRKATWTSHIPQSLLS